VQPPFISSDIESELSWLDLLDILEQGHRAPRAQLTDSFLSRGAETLLSRAAWIDGVGALVKTAMVFPENPSAGIPAVNGSVALYSDQNGRIDAFLDFHLVTKWKTAADSLLATRHLARKEARAITLVGAGTVAASMYDAYRALFPEAEFTIWTRRPESAREFAQGRNNICAGHDLQTAVQSADIICTATLSKTPIIDGTWLSEGQHLDLIGAFRADMREVDDTALTRAALFVDSFDTTLAHIGELKDPLARKVIAPQDVLADFYDISSGKFARPSQDAITICKNGGGAHLDLMVSAYIFDKWKRKQKNIG